MVEKKDNGLKTIEFALQVILFDHRLDVFFLGFVNERVEVVKVFMAKRWLEILVEKEQKSLLEVKEQTQSSWLTRNTS